MPRKFNTAEKLVAIMKAINTEKIFCLIKFKIISFVATFTYKVDRYKNIKIINLKKPLIEFLNVKNLFAK